MGVVEEEALCVGVAGFRRCNRLVSLTQLTQWRSALTLFYSPFTGEVHRLTQHQLHRLHQLHLA